MGLFSFFRKGHPESNSNDNSNSPEVPRELFVDDSEPSNSSATVFATNAESQGLMAIYAFLQGDYDSRGYDDSLTNPDDGYKTENIKLIKMDLEILIEKSMTYYGDTLSRMDLHIETRSRAGLIDLVEELKKRKEQIREHIAKVNTLKNDNEKGTGITQRIIMSYRRGFMRGLAAITQSKVLN